MTKELKTEIISWAKLLITAFLIAILLRTFVFQIAIVDQISMYPTLKPGDMLIVSRLSYKIGQPNRGDVAVLKDDSAGKLLVKRLMALPGETVELLNGKTYINGIQLTKDWNTSDNIDFPIFEVPMDEYFMMGDNRLHSRDSRSDTLGPVERDLLVGKVIFRIWPLNKIGTIND